MHLAPAPTSNSYQTALQAGPLQSISIGPVVSNNANLSGSRIDGTYTQTDGWVDGTGAADNLTNNSTDVQGDRVDENPNAINAGTGNDTVNAGGGNDTVLGGAGNDVINGGTGDDLIRGDSAIGTQTTFS